MYQNRKKSAATNTPRRWRKAKKKVSRTKAIITPKKKGRRPGQGKAQYKKNFLQKQERAKERLARSFR